MASDVLVDPITFSKPNNSRRRFLIPIIVALIVAIVGIVYLLTNAYTAVRAYPKVSVNANSFYLTTPNRPFVPRGTNFVRLAQSPTGLTYHSVFEPGQYNPASIKASLTGMKNSGYNVVRVFIDAGEFTAESHGISSGVNSNEPIRAAYMANVIDFIKQAISMGIYTIPIIDGIPANTYYYKVAGSPTGNIQGQNTVYLDPRYVQAKEMYVKEFIKALQAGLPAGSRSGVLAYQTDNEVFFAADQPPFSTLSGTLTSLDGVPYDMSKPDRRQQAADANLVTYTHRMKAAITSVDPNGLLTLGFFTNNAVKKTAFNGTQAYCSNNCSSTVDYRFPGRPSAVSIFGKADFIDMHVYSSGPNYSLKDDLASSEYTLFQKLYIIGEFGTEKSRYANVTNAAVAMKNLQVASCSLNAKGWLFWTWDTNLTTSLAHQGLFYSLADNNGAINGQLAPAVRPDPCR
jgi:endo-1,4-beta-mannosidase